MKHTEAKADSQIPSSELASPSAWLLMTPVVLVTVVSTQIHVSYQSLWTLTTITIKTCSEMTMQDHDREN